MTPSQEIAFIGMTIIMLVAIAYAAIQRIKLKATKDVNVMISIVLGIIYSESREKDELKKIVDSALSIFRDKFDIKDFFDENMDSDQCK